MGLSVYLTIFNHHKELIHNANLGIVLNNIKHKLHKAHRNFTSNNFFLMFLTTA